MAVQMQATDSGPYRYVICPRYKRNMLRMVAGGATMMCKSCGQPHFYSREELNQIWDTLEAEQAQQRPTEIKH
jgi:hypothetical protein